MQTRSCAAPCAASRALTLVVAASAAVLAAAGGAHALAGHAVDTAAGSARLATDPVLNLQLNPLADTGSDPLANTVSAQVADFAPVGTAAATGPLAAGASARELAPALLGGLPTAR